MATICYTLSERAKLAGVDSHRDVLEATRRAIAAPGAATLPEDLTGSDSAQIPSHSPHGYRMGTVYDDLTNMA